MVPGGMTHDARDLLYSSQLAFGRDGIPMLTVGVMEGQPRVTLTSPSGLVLTLSGPGQARVRIPGGHELTATVLGGRPGKTHYRVVLAATRGGDLKTIQGIRKAWNKRGLELAEVSIGGIVGFPSRVLDNRKSLLVEKRVYGTRRSAEKRARQLMERWKLKSRPTVYGQPLTRAKGTVVVTDPRSGLVIQQADLLTFTSADGGPVTVKNVEYGRGYRHHGFEDRRYRGQIVIAVDKTAHLTVVNRLSSEEILQGIVPMEIYPTAPTAALEAQAIAARSELFAKIGVKNLADPFLVCATQRCQVYGGVDKEKPATTRAVRRTRGKMIFSPKDYLVDGVYHASCGGSTEHNEHVWEGVANATLRGKYDGPPSGRPWPKGQVPTLAQLKAFLARTPQSYASMTRLGRHVLRWKKTFTQEQLDRLVNARYAIGTVESIQVLQRGVSGRVKLVRFLGTKGGFIVKGEYSVRILLDNLKSGLFVLSYTNGVWEFTGAGWGHGVGMCQYGAIGRATQGQSAPQILSHYFQGSRIMKVY